MPGETDLNQGDSKPSRLSDLKLFISRFNFKKILGFSFVFFLTVATCVSVYITSNKNQSQDIRSKAAELSGIINSSPSGKIAASPNPLISIKGQNSFSTVTWSTTDANHVCILRMPNPLSSYWVFDCGNPSGTKNTNFQTFYWPDTLVLYANYYQSLTPQQNISLGKLKELARVTLTTSLSSGIALGVYQPPPAQKFSDPNSWGQAIDDYTKEVGGKKPAFAWRSVRWEAADGTYIPFVGAYLDQFRTRGIMPGVNWDASKGSPLTRYQTDFSWKNIASGMHDTYITQWAKDAAVYHYPFVMRLFSELDGNYYPWGYNAPGQENTNPADFVAAWKKIVGIFRKAGATNVQFVWCLAANYIDASTINQYGDILKQLYPGDDYVDWVALDGYSNLVDTNKGALQNDFQPTYNFIKTFTHRPMIFYEVGVAEDPNDSMAKANWITQGFLTAIPTVFPDVKIVNWFNGPSDYNPNKLKQPAVNWTVDSSQNSLDAWKQVVASPLYQGSLLK